MRKTLFILLCVWMAVSCTERPQRPVYHTKLVQIDSILQHDSLKWKNLGRGEMIPDVFLYVDTLEEGESPIYDGTVEYIQETGKRVFKKDMLRPLDVGFGERGVQTKVARPLFLLDKFPMDSLATEADSMYYALLKMEAQVKDYMVRKNTSPGYIGDYLVSDSVFRKVVDYYDRLQDRPMQARAHSLLAFRLRGIYSKPVDAVREYLIALRYAKEVGDEELEAFIYRFLGRTYYFSHIYQQSDSIFTLAEQLAIKQRDTMLWMEAIQYRLKSTYEMGRGETQKAREEAHQRFLQRIRQGMDLAHAYGCKEYEGDFAVMLGEEYLSSRGNDAQRYKKALYYGKLAESFGQHIGSVNKLLAKAYWGLGYPDSAAVHLDKVYGDDWRERGPFELWAELNNMQPDRIGAAAVEAELQKEWQQERYENSLLHHRYLTVYIVMAGGVLALVLNGYHRRRYRKQSERLAEQQKKTQSLHAVLQEGLEKKEAEIVRLQEELAHHAADEAARKNLMEELNTANENRDILAQETMKQSPAYNKVQLIMADYRWKDESDHKLTEADWQELTNGVDACYNKVLARLMAQYQLDEREQRICCLSLLDVPVVHIAHLIGYTRPVIYKTEQKILQKMGYAYEKGYLRKLLKTI